MIDLTKYQREIQQFYTPEVAADLLTYSREALVAEVGEVVGLRAKRRRGDAALQDAAAYREAVVLEMGDVLFSLASICTAWNMVFEIRSLSHDAFTLRDILVRAGQVVTTSKDLYIDWYAEDLLGALWYYDMAAGLHFDTLEHITRANIAKLTARQAAGTIRGSGEGENRR